VQFGSYFPDTELREKREGKRRHQKKEHPLIKVAGRKLFANERKKEKETRASPTSSSFHQTTTGESKEKGEGRNSRPGGENQQKEKKRKGALLSPVQTRPLEGEKKKKERERLPLWFLCSPGSPKKKGERTKTLSTPP